MNDKLQVMLVDDSAVVRGMLSRVLDGQPDIEVTASVSNGQLALSSYQRNRPDLVIMDIEMPVMDGITALGELLKIDPDAKIVMCSSLSTHNAEITLRAMSIGAMECIAKPTSASQLGGEGSFSEDLLRIVRTLGRLRSARPETERAARPASVPHAPMEARRHEREASVQSAPLPVQLGADGAPKLREYRPMGKLDLLAIGSSTGGPQALFETIKPLKDKLNVPLIITQHMPPTFTRMLAQHIATNTGVTCVEAEDGMKLEAGKGIVAQGGYHMILEQQGTDVIVRLGSGPMENFCKPAVDPMLRSAYKIYGRRMAVAILTGMGSDGARACKDLVEGGVYLVAQDKKTSVVWGMPGAVAEAGLCHNILPVNEIGAQLLRVLPSKGTA